MDAVQPSILVIGPMPPPTHGAARVTEGAVGAFISHGFSVDVARTSPAFKTSGLNYHIQRLALHLRAACHILRPSIPAVYIAGAGGHGLWYQAGLTALARAAGKEVVFHHHSSSYLNKRSLAMLAIARLSTITGTHIFLTNTMRSAYLKQYPSPAGSNTISNSIYCGNIDPECNHPIKPQRELIVGHLSNLSIEKGLAVVLECARAAATQGLPVVFRIAGPVNDSAASRLIKEALEEPELRIQYMGKVPPEEVPGFMQSIDLFLFPSRYRHEAEPLVVLEAIDSCTPVMATPVGGLREMIGGLGWVTSSEADYVSEFCKRITEGREAWPQCRDFKIHREARNLTALEEQTQLLTHISKGA